MKDHIDAIYSRFPSPLRKRIFLVGGTVRSLLSGERPSDLDIAAALSDEEFAALGFCPVTGRSTARIMFKTDRQFGKIEAKQLGQPTGLAQDLRERDFTANAMALTVNGELIDPLNGAADLRQRLLRSCRPTVFSDDPLRAFRAFRFACDGWLINGEIEELLGALDQNSLNGIPVERFSAEMLKALAAPRPWIFFEQMLAHSLGQGYLPELFRMPDIPAGPLEHHPEGDLLSHSLQVLQRAAQTAADPLTRFCGLFHDLGKLATLPENYPRHHGHEQGGYKLSLAMCARLQLPKAYGRALAGVSSLHGTLHRWSELRDATRIELAEKARRAGIDRILPIVAGADKAAGVSGAAWERALEIAVMNAEQLGVEEERLTAMPPESRRTFLLQEKIRLLRKTMV